MMIEDDDDLYENFIFSEDKKRLICRLQVFYLNNHIKSLNFFPLPLSIRNNIESSLGDDFIEEMVYNNGAKLEKHGYGSIYEFTDKIEQLILKEIEPYDYLKAPDHLVSYFNVDFEQFEDWMYDDLNKENLKYYFNLNKFYHLYYKDRINQNMFFLANFTRFIFEKAYIEGKSSISSIEINETQFLSYLNDEFSELYFRISEEENLRIFMVELRADLSKESDENEVNKIDKNEEKKNEDKILHPVIYALNDCNELVFFRFNSEKEEEEEEEFHKEVVDLLSLLYQHL